MAGGSMPSSAARRAGLLGGLGVLLRAAAVLGRLAGPVDDGRRGPDGVGGAKAGGGDVHLADRRAGTEAGLLALQGLCCRLEDAGLERLDALVGLARQRVGVGARQVAALLADPAELQLTGRGRPRVVELGDLAVSLEDVPRVVRGVVGVAGAIDPKLGDFLVGAVGILLPPAGLLQLLVVAAYHPALPRHALAQAARHGVREPGGYPLHRRLHRRVL